MNAQRLGITLFLWVGLGGCVVGPHYRPPDVSSPKTWNGIEKSGTTTGPPEITRWWTTFNDTILNSLIERADESNLDLRLAMARIREVRALYGVTEAGRGATVNTSGSYSRNRRSDNAPFISSTATPSVARDSNLFQFGFDAGWEIDLFGGVQHAIEAAEADIAASVEEHHAVRITLFGEVARNYIKIRRLQREIAMTHHNIASQQVTLDLIQARFKAGLNSDLDVARAEALVSTTASQIPALDSELKQAIHRLSVLLGKEPASLFTELSKEGPIPSVPSEVPIGLPADLLRRRPDIRRAERELAAATARTGVATADLFPRFSLTGSFGLQSADSKDLVSDSSTFFSLGPRIRWPIFDAGRIRANIQVQNVRQEEALTRYEKAILSALEDVENALVSYSMEQSRRQLLSEAVAANRRAVALVNELFTKGLVNFLDVLESERSLFASERQLVESETALSEDRVALYKALGGGWDAPPL